VLCEQVLVMSRFQKEPPPPPSQILDLPGLLAEFSITADTGELSLKFLVDTYADGNNRPGLLNALKEGGVSKLADRQAIAGAVGKAVRAERFVDAAKAGWPHKAGPVTSKSPTAVVDISDAAPAATAMSGPKPWEATAADAREVAVLFPGQGTQKVTFSVEPCCEPAETATHSQPPESPTDFFTGWHGNGST
jgi:hypothetical protein